MFSRDVKRYLLVGLLAICFVSSSKADVTIFSDNFNGYTLGTNSPTSVFGGNWTVSNGTVDVIGNPGFFDFLPGNGRYIDLDGSTEDAGDFSSLALNLIGGQTYRVSFDLAGSQRGDNNTVLVSFGSLSGPIALTSSIGFTNFFGLYTPTSNETVSLVFSHAGGDNVGLLLDNVLIQKLDSGNPVPEPASMISLLAGIATVSGAAYRRRFKKA